MDYLHFKILCLITYTYNIIGLSINVNKETQIVNNNIKISYWGNKSSWQTITFTDYWYVSMITETFHVCQKTYTITYNSLMAM